MTECIFSPQTQWYHVQTWTGHQQQKSVPDLLCDICHQRDHFVVQVGYFKKVMLIQDPMIINKVLMKKDFTSLIHWKDLILKAHKKCISTYIIQVFTASQTCREKCAHINKKTNKQLFACWGQNKYLYTVYNTCFLTNLNKYKHCLIQKIWNNWISGISRLCILRA